MEITKQDLLELLFLIFAIAVVDALYPQVTNGVFIGWVIAKLQLIGREVKKK